MNEDTGHRTRHDMRGRGDLRDRVVDAGSKANLLVDLEVVACEVRVDGVSSLVPQHNVSWGKRERGKWG